MSPERCDVLLVGEQTAHVVRLAAGLLRRGLAVQALDADRLRAQLQREAGLDLLTHTLPRIRLRGRYRLACVRRLERWATRARLRRLLHDVRPGLIHINAVDPRHALFPELGSACPPIVATVWGTDVHTFARHGTAQQRRDITAVLQHARVITADSPYMLELVRDLVGPRAQDTLRLALFGIDIEPFAIDDHAAGVAWVQRLRLEPGAAVVLAPRRINPRYAPERLLEGFARSVAARRAHLVFKLFGDNPGEEPRQQQRLLARARELGVDARVRFAPPCAYAELPALYRLAAAGCFILDRDGMPSTAMELWAAGVPVIAADIPHYRDMLVHERNALLVAPRDPAALAAALDRVLLRPASTESLIRGGREWVRRWGSDAAMMRAMLAAYRRAGLTATRPSPIRESAAAMPVVPA